MKNMENNRDFWAGVMFIVVGIVAVVAARNYPFGTTLRMGPGYFPTVLGSLMIVFGLITAVHGLYKGEKIPGHWSIRALIILPLAFAVYGVMMEVVGFIPALIALIFVSAASSREFNFKQVVLLTAVLVAISWGIFIWGLGLPYPLFVQFW